MSLVRNLILAEQAARYANDKLLGRSSNRSEDMVRTVVKDVHSVYDYMDKADLDALVIGEIKPGEFYRQQQLVFLERSSQIENARDRRDTGGDSLHSAAIIHDNIGNCFEHSALACSYLNDGSRRVSGQPIASYIVDTDQWTNHSFVLIGAPPGLAGETIKVKKDDFGAINTGET